MSEPRSELKMDQYGIERSSSASTIAGNAEAGDGFELREFITVYPKSEHLI